MANGIYAAMSGAVSRSMALDVVANNVANAPTPGYRADAVAYRQESPQAQGAAPGDGDLHMATVDAVVPSWRQGPLEETSSPSDVAIEGDGLLLVQTDEGVRYTRGGSLMLGTDGALVTNEGHPLLDVEGRPLRIPPGGEPSISGDGTVMVGENRVGRLAMTWFDDPAVLNREGGNLYSAPADANSTTAPGLLRQGYIEQANVNVVRGMIDLVSLTRSYEATVRVMESFGDIDRRTARDLAQG